MSPYQNQEIIRSQLKKDDVLLTITGVSYGKSAVVTDEYVGANINATFRKNDGKKYHPLLFVYFLKLQIRIFSINKTCKWELPDLR